MCALFILQGCEQISRFAEFILNRDDGANF